MAKLITCKTCGAQIAKTAKRCPQCGAQQHIVALTFAWLLFFFILIMLFILCRTIFREALATAFAALQL